MGGPSAEHSRCAEHTRYHVIELLRKGGEHSRCAEHSRYPIVELLRKGG